MTKIFVPSSGPGDWRGLLADPEKHWARGYSARTLAHCWEDSDGFPEEIRKILVQNSALTDAQPLLIFPEWKVSLPGGSRPSQNDVWVLAKNSVGLTSAVPDTIRYQLLHRTASAVIETEPFGACHAVMLVQSFSKDTSWFGDFVAFAALFGVPPEVGKLATTTAT